MATATTSTYRPPAPTADGTPHPPPAAPPAPGTSIDLSLSNNLATYIFWGAVVYFVFFDGN